MGVLKRIVKLIAGRPVVRVSIQATVSLGLLALLVYFAVRKNVFDTLQNLDPGFLAMAIALHFVATTINSARWQVLLRNVGVEEPLGRLTALYMIGQYVSLFLPTSAGGDAVRIYDVARRTHKPAETIVATLQERLLALGAILLVGLVATLWFMPLFPPALRVWIILAQLGAAVGIGMLLYPALFFAVARWTWRVTIERWGMGRHAEHPLIVKILSVLRPMAELPPLRPLPIVGLFLMAVAPALMFIGMYYVVGRSLGIDPGFAAYCLAVPLVAIVRMLPISLNGVGVGEYSLVFLIGLFGVPEAQALALAVAMFALLTCLALVGGLVLLGRVVQGTWKKGHPATSADPASVDRASLLVPSVNGHSGEKVAAGDSWDAPPVHRAVCLRNGKLEESGVEIGSVPAAILAGGLATRLRPITETIPKALVEVGGRPFIDHQMRLLQRHGIRRVVLCLGYLGEKVEAHLGDGAALGLEVKYSFDGDKLLGTGGALRRALPMLGDVFWVMYGDSYMDIDYPAILRHFAARNVLGLMTVIRNEDRWDTSNAVFKDGNLLTYDKKNRVPDMNYIDYGIALLRREALERILPGEKADLADLYTALVKEGQMIGYEVTNRFYEIGTPAALAEADAYLREVEAQ